MSLAERWCWFPALHSNKAPLIGQGCPTADDMMSLWLLQGLQSLVTAAAGGAEGPAVAASWAMQLLWADSTASVLASVGAGHPASPGVPG